MDATDQALLREFATRRCDASFRRLVERHLALVYSVAERVTGDRGLAEEIAQTTFATFAEKSAALDADTVIAGWLYHTARNLALMTVRSEVRRRQREKIAATMNTDEPGPSVVAEHLESAMDQLKPEDRDALVLRFFEDRNLRDVGHELGLTEDAARMRVNRALEKLRGVFGKLGITGSAAWLGVTLTTSATASVPAGLGASITTAVLSGTAIAASATAIVTQTTATSMNLFNLKTAVVILATAALTSTSTVLLVKQNIFVEKPTLIESDTTGTRSNQFGVVNTGTNLVEDVQVEWTRRGGESAGRAPDGGARSQDPCAAGPGSGGRPRIRPASATCS